MFRPAFPPSVRLALSTGALLTALAGTAVGDDLLEGVRTPWTTSRIAGTPEPPPPYAIEPAFPAIRFDRPLLVASAPGLKRLFVGEQGGKIVSFPNQRDVSRTDLLIDLAARKPGCSALYGLAFHPKFGENRHVFVCYVTRDGDPDGTRLSRFTATGLDPPRLDPESERLLLTWPSGGHNGGCLAFGPDGYLYVSTGDADNPSPPDPRDTGQDLSDLLSSVLRIDVDQSDPGRAYRVPPDNPFVKLPKTRPEIWAYGFRNPWKMSFDRVRGDLWLGDVGWELWEMIHRVERGGNYGWSVVEGPQPVHPEGRRGPTPILPPTQVHPHSEAASITGGFVYRGTRFPDLVGTYVYGDYQSGKVWGLRHDGLKVTWRGVLAETPLELVSFGEDDSGELYLLDYERTRQLHRFVPNPAANRASGRFPKTLSETGLFASTSEHRPAPGVAGYEVNAPLWSDHTEAERLVALPGGSQIEIGEKGEWRLPEGAVLARTVSIDRERGNPASRVRLETQVLHLEAESWRPYTYVWNEAQTDALLADAEGSSRTLAIVDPTAPGGRRTQVYRVPSRAECTLCHNPWVEKKATIFGRQSASPLGFNTAQLNQPVDGHIANQLDLFRFLGLFARPLPAQPDQLPRLVNPYDPSADLNLRARAYLQVNCAHCHQFNAGGTATILLSNDLPLDKMQAVNVRPSQGTFGISDARVIRPGDPEGSVLLYRVAKLGGGRMPRVGSSVVDEKAVAMLGEWIARLDGKAGGESPSGPGAPERAAALKALETNKALGIAETGAAVDSLFGSTRGALALMRAIDRGRLPASGRDEAVRKSLSHPSVEVRDLFERFVPEAQRVVRLGDSIDPRTILDREGDARRGREVFFNNNAAQCKTCHKLEGIGEPLGPDLAKIGAKYPKAELLRQVLAPSASIDPSFATIVVETKAGEVISGLLASKTATEVVLKDAQSRLTRIPAATVEQITPQSRSLMPESLLRDLTAQQAADLLEYLGSLR